MFEFSYREIKCSSCRLPGLTRAIIYDVRRYLVMSHRSDDDECIQLIDEVDLLFIEPSNEHPKVDYTPNTVFFVLENGEVFYLRKIQDGFSYYNKVAGRFEKLIDISALDVKLSTNWMVFVYEVDNNTTSIPLLRKIIGNQQNLGPAIEADVLTIDTVQTILPSFKESFDVADVSMKKKEINTLLDDRGDLNDIIIDAYLSMIASTVQSTNTVLAVPCHQISAILTKRLKRFDLSWLAYDVI